MFVGTEDNEVTNFKYGLIKLSVSNLDIQLIFFYICCLNNYKMTKNNFPIIPDEIISNKIYFFREKKIMLDKDLALLYGVTTSNLNKAVKRNIKRFPDDFMFQLTKQEFDNLIFQFGTSSLPGGKAGWGGTRSLPYAFTEQGVAMLSGILNSDRAIRVNIQIMRIFTKIREMLVENLSIRLEVEAIKKKLTNHDKNIELIFNYLDELIEKHEKPQPRKQIGFKKPDDE